MSTTDEQRMRVLRDRIAPILSDEEFDWISGAIAALAQQAPTPAVPSAVREPEKRCQTKQLPQCTAVKCTWPACEVSEPAAPADARDEALRRLMMWGGMPPDGDFSGTIARGVCDWYEAGRSGELPPLPSWARDAAIARQAAAPAIPNLGKTS